VRRPKSQRLAVALGGSRSKLDGSELAADAFVYLIYVDRMRITEPTTMAAENVKVI